ncbi:Lipase-like pad4 [Thalictrum thalictroides]|uniref:Lipase-like pad4 n=1 Tax=Thalictrum thalictroides TaxID=46969 RepID=A0A7J6WFG2_THATH|nr:Lipase-like pad4 [Thalictrum thalictroides]
MEAKETSWFETSEMLAEFLASTSLLFDSWRLCNSTYTNTTTVVPGSFAIELVGDVGYVCFSAIAAGLNLNENQLMGIDKSLFSSLKGEDEDSPMVHAGFLHLFLSVYNDAEFQNKMLRLMEKCKAIIFTGHSIGGAIASLAALWLMSLPTHHSAMSITFGSPLLGNESLSKAILRERWGGNFINVVSKHDIVPRLLFAPLTMVGAQLNNLLQLWHLSMTSPQFGHLASQLSDNDEIREFHRYILAHVTAAATTTTTSQDESMRSLYRPFGSYLFCSIEGAICVDNTSAVVNMLYLMFTDSSANSSIDDHLRYGEVVTRVSQQFLTKGFTQGVHISDDSSYEVGLSSALNAAGLGSQVHIELHGSVAQQARKCLMEAREMSCEQNINSGDLTILLAKRTPLRAQIEWYKACCDDSDDQMGYYDSFKLRRAKRDCKVNLNRMKLGNFWDKVIEMVETNKLPHDFHMRGKWVNASQFYKLLVEPLDIAEYYRSGMHRTKGHYLEHGRERRYEIFDKWWRERKVPAEESYKRDKYAGLTQDSCFWARVEEASEWVKNARTQNDPHKLAQLWENIDRFETYARRLVDSKEVSKDVVAPHSSYTMWVEELKELKSQSMQMSPRFPGYLGGEGSLSSIL